MNDEILTHLQGITAQEQAILGGRKTINRDIYMQGRGNIINTKKLLAAGKLITIRPHTRFIHFPEHTHDYVEARAMVKAAYEHQGPVYMRFGRSAVPVVHQENFEFQNGISAMVINRATIKPLDIQKTKDYGNLRIKAPLQRSQLVCR